MAPSLFKTLKTVFVDLTIFVFKLAVGNPSIILSYFEFTFTPSPNF